MQSNKDLSCPEVPRLDTLFQPKFKVQLGFGSQVKDPKITDGSL